MTWKKKAAADYTSTASPTGRWPKHAKYVTTCPACKRTIRTDDVITLRRGLWVCGTCAYIEPAEFSKLIADAD